MDIEEYEIKIEYNEGLGSDPLHIDVNKIEELGKNCNRSSESIDERQNLQSDCTSHINHNDLNTQGNVKTWFQSIDSTGKLLCKFCELKYSTVQTLRHHVKCKHPDEAEKLRKLIINNKRNHKLICHICKKRFKYLADLKLHMKDHCMELVKTSCIHCNAVFNNSECLTDHIYLKHQQQNKIKFMCKICGYQTLKKSHYQQHINTHKDEKTIKCRFCDYKTNYSPNLRIHEHIHTNNKPYLCDFKNCDYRSAAKSALRSHQLKHYPQDNMFFCEKCSYSTVYKQSLKKHLESHARNFTMTKRKIRN